ncbi:MAG: hypothetical protein IKN87_04985 [Bacilli bacterium]|nr:hypothetical protein [Bacilli bacterium]
MTNFNINNHMFMFMIENGNIYLLLKRKDNKIIVPKYNYDGEGTIEKSIALSFYKDANVKGIMYHQCHTFSKNNNIDIIFVSITNRSLASKMNEDFMWYSLNETDNKIIPEHVIDYLKTYLNKIDNIRNILPKYFSLKELQTLYENIFKTTYDRRNFRKRLINLGIVKTDEEYAHNGSNGRPNKLYSFTDLKNINIM